MSNPTSKEALLQSLVSLDSNIAKSSLIKLFEAYLNPAFGSLPKRELDILLFQILQDLDIFNNTPDMYSMVSSLRVTRPKARTLLYESNLRRTNNDSIEDELIEYLKNPILLKDSDKVCLEIDNPLLIDHLRKSLKDLRHITDGSFSAELVKLTPEAYKSLLNKKLCKVSKEIIDAALIECGSKKKVNVQTILTGVLKKVGKKVADDTGDQAGEFIGDYLGDLFTMGFVKAKEFISSYDGEDIELIES